MIILVECVKLQFLGGPDGGRDDLQSNRLCDTREVQTSTGGRSRAGRTIRVGSKLDKLETGMTRLQDTKGNQMDMMKLMLKAQNVPEGLINQYMPPGGAGCRPQAKGARPVSAANKGAQPSQAKTKATQIHEEYQDMADNSDDSGNLFDDCVKKQKFLADTKSAAACTVNDIKEPIMWKAPHLVGLVLRTRSRTECVCLMSHVFDAGLWTYLEETKAVETGFRSTEVIDGYAVDASTRHMPGATCHRHIDCWPSGPSRTFGFYACLHRTVGHHHVTEYMLFFTACGGKRTEGGCFIITISQEVKIQASGPAGCKPYQRLFVSIYQMQWPPSSMHSRQKCKHVSTSSTT